MSQSLNYLKDEKNGAHVFLHHFGTGHQELIFNKWEDADKFARGNNCVLRRPLVLAGK